MADPAVVTLVGPLNADELDELLAFIRQLCDRRPEEHFTVVVDDPRGDMAQGERVDRAMIDNPVIQRCPWPKGH